MPDPTPHLGWAVFVFLACLIVGLVIVLDTGIAR